MQVDEYYRNSQAVLLVVCDSCVMLFVYFSPKPALHTQKSRKKSYLCCPSHACGSSTSCTDGRRRPLQGTIQNGKQKARVSQAAEYQPLRDFAIVNTHALTVSRSLSPVSYSSCRHVVVWSIRKWVCRRNLDPGEPLLFLYSRVGDMVRHAGSAGVMDPLLRKEGLSVLAAMGFGKKQPRHGAHKHHRIAARTRLAVAGKVNEQNGIGCLECNCCI